MVESQSNISLGFTDEKFPAGTHICQIFGDDAEREDSILKFLLAGLQVDERTALFSDKTGVEELSAFMAENGVSYEDAENAELISVAGTKSFYLPDDEFDPDYMLDQLAEHYDKSVADGCPGARAIGEVNPGVCHVPGGERLCEYESRITIMLRDRPVTAICQYDATAFDGATIMDVLKVHPMMVVRGAVVRNPFFIEPEDFLYEIH